VPGLTGTLYDETYDLASEAAATWPLGLIDLTAYDLDIELVQLTTPRVTFIAPVRALGIGGSVGVTTVTAQARAMGVTASARATTYSAAARAMGVSGSVGVSTITAPVRALGVTAAVRP
jgi:hypothetical protein